MGLGLSQRGWLDSPAVRSGCGSLKKKPAATMKLFTATLEPVREMGASDPPGPIKTSRDTCFFPGYESPVVTTPPHLLPRLPEGWMPGALTLPFSLFPIPCQHLCRKTVQLRDGLACSRSNWTSSLWSPGPSYTASSFLWGKMLLLPVDQSGRCVMVERCLFVPKTA